VSCVVDPADDVQISSVAPGQLLTIFGTDLAAPTPFIPSGGVTASTNNFGVFFNGIGAPVLYSSADQINVQVPYEIAGQSTVEMQLMSQETPLADSATLSVTVTPRQPSVFLTAATEASLFPACTVCGGAMALGVAALALNADGTLNDCTNPAAPGSIVTIFVNGLGQVTPGLATGSVAEAPAVGLSPGIMLVDGNGNTIPATTLTDPGSLDGVAQVQLRAPAVSGTTTAVALVPELSGTVLRERLILLWVRPN
jgi:uncharacterized protein (TIGR03437 family)